MKRPQLKLFTLSRNDVFGGSLLKGNATKKRVIPRGVPMHITLKSEIAVGARSMLLFHREIREHINKHAHLTAGVRLYDFVNVGNHIHILAEFHNRYAYHKFIRVISGLIARTVLGAQRGASKGLRFWTYKPYSKLIHAGRRHFTNVCYYLTQNKAQLFGVDRKLIASKDPVTLSFLEILKNWDPLMVERSLV